MSRLFLWVGCWGLLVDEENNHHCMAAESDARELCSSGEFANEEIGFKDRSFPYVEPMREPIFIGFFEKVRTNNIWKTKADQILYANSGAVTGLIAYREDVTLGIGNNKGEWHGLQNTYKLSDGSLEADAKSTCHYTNKPSDC